MRLCLLIIANIIIFVVTAKYVSCKCELAIINSSTGVSNSKKVDSDHCILTKLIDLSYMTCIDQCPPPPPLYATLTP